jgi:hypothetical protein
VTSRCGSSDIGAIVLIEEEEEENGKKEAIAVKGALLYTKGEG